MYYSRMLQEPVEVEKGEKREKNSLLLEKKGMLFCDGAPSCQEVLHFNERTLFGRRRHSVF